MAAAASKRELPNKSNWKRRFVNVLADTLSVFGWNVKKNATDVVAMTGRLIQKHHLHLLQISMLISTLLLQSESSQLT
jgi:hypothetical protein